MHVDREESTGIKPPAAQLHLPNGVPTSSAATQTLGATGRVMSLSSGSSIVQWCYA